MRFLFKLLQNFSRYRNGADGEIADVDMIGALKRGYPTTDENFINNHSTKLARENSKKIRSKLSDSGAHVEGVSRLLWIRR